MTAKGYVPKFLYAIGMYISGGIMQQVSSTVLQFRGSHYDFGHFQGEQIKLTNYLQNRAMRKMSISKRFTVDVHHITQLLQTFAPGILDEIYGLADSLEMELEEAFMQFGGYFANMISGCSILIENDYFLRNYDQEPSTYDGRYVLYAPTDNGYATIGPTMMITGRTDGMNEHGLVIGYNFVNSRKHEDGFVCNMIARIVLETCATTDEAVQLLERLPHKHSFNYCLLDASGVSRIVEASPRGVAVRTGQACTNHFHLLEAENRYTMADSLRREEIILTRAAENPSFQDGYSLLNNLEEDIFATKYSAWDGTIHTATYHPQTLTATITYGSNSKPMPISFRNWLAGTPLLISKIKGELSATNRFTSE